MIKVKTIISGRSWTALTSRLLLLLAMCFFQSLMPAACGVTFTNDITLASAPEVSSDMVRINAIGGEVDVVYKNSSGIVYRKYLTGSSLSSAEIVDSSPYCYWLAGLGRGNGKIKVGYNCYNVLKQSSRDLGGTAWTSASTGQASVTSSIAGAYAVNPVTQLGGFVACAANSTAYYISETADGQWSAPATFLNTAAGTYPDLTYGADGTPYIGVDYGTVNGAGPGAWGGALGDLRMISNANIYFHSAFAERNGIRYFARALNNSQTRLYYTNAQGNWIDDGLISATGYYGDSRDYAMDISPSGKIAVLLFDKRSGDAAAALYLATKDGLGGGYSWQFTRLADGINHCPDLKYDTVDNLYVAYYDSGDSKLHLKTTAIIFTPEQFGALGNGSYDDSDAFNAAALAIYTQGSGTLVLTAGKTYRIGRQYHASGQFPYYKSASMFSLGNTPVKSNLWVVIEGNGATIKMNDGMRIGSFDENTGAVYNPTLPFTDQNYKAAPGTMLAINGCSRVYIQNVVIDGNSTSMILGGLWGDQGRQCLATGIYLYNCDYIRIANVDSSYCGLDGITLGYSGLTETSPSQDWGISDSSFEYNARQGFSWVGGKGLIVTNCKFNHTGRGYFASSPGAGLDNEAEDSINRNGLFVSCDFVNNVGCGMVADSGDSKNITFDDCLFWGTTNWSIWPRKPGIKFEGCNIYGTAVNAFSSDDPNEATQFTNCHFEDMDDTYEGIPLTSYRNTALVNFSGKNLLFDNCILVANQTKSFYLDNTSNTKTVRNCTITHNWADPLNHDFLCLLRGVNISNTTFHESLNTSNLFYIAIQSVTVGPGVYVDGPLCKWANWSWGTIGLIPES